ncbi:hypothetical protein J2S74_002199 [Evansella vedderi]|uniref:Preprotein translocase subunit YajC n=1 Tax=Evansella vedderi TaxID=38282 RepID=A0ABT9ZUA1_9BACI|nr:hypothetical protein [Evansella vedderi]
MFYVTYFEKTNLLLSQILKRAPSEGEEIKIKGRKGKVVGVNSIDEKNVHVQIIFENVKKNKPTVDPKKRK